DVSVRNRVHELEASAPWPKARWRFEFMTRRRGVPQRPAKLPSIVPAQRFPRALPDVVSGCGPDTHLGSSLLVSGREIGREGSTIGARIRNVAQGLAARGLERSARGLRRG